MELQTIHAREILDSRGNPTLEVEVILTDGATGRAAVPAGPAPAYEACELRDGDKDRYLGKGVLKAVHNVNEIIAPALLGMNASEQIGIDRRHDRTRRHPEQDQARRQRHSRRLAGRRPAAAASVGLPLYRYLGGTNAKVLPVPMMNILNGGKHADNNVDFQEFMIMPVGAAPSARRCAWERRSSTASKKCCTIKPSEHVRRRRRRLRPEPQEQPTRPSRSSPRPSRRPATSSANRSSSPSIPPPPNCSTKPRRRARTATASSRATPTASPARDEMIDLWKKLCAKWPIRSLEDGLAEDDWAGWQKLTTRTGRQDPTGRRRPVRHQHERLQEGIDKKAANSILVKVNQIGTLTETLDAIELAKRNGFTRSSAIAAAKPKTRPSPTSRSPPTPGQIKTGSASRTDRIAKYNQLLRIEEDLGEQARYGV